MHGATGLLPRIHVTRGCTILVFALLAFPPAFLASEALAGIAPTAFAPGAVIGNRTWSQDLRITRSGYADYSPQLMVDANHDAHFLWLSDRSPSGYYFMSLD